MSYDFVGQVQAKTGLAKSTVARILLDSARLADAVNNPQAFIDHAVEAVNAVKREVLAPAATQTPPLQCFSYAALKRALERRAANAPVVAPALTQSGPHIRALTEYESFWETHSHTHPQEDTDGNVYH